ncbi:hypothetical protein [Curtobacterium sp. 24E2]|nr:hypothetical protein JN350_10800 [Curtobacterium sp. 24E2]
MTALSWATVLPTMALPARTDPIYPPERAPSKSDLIPLYGDDIWPVRFFSNNPSMEDARILWTTFPPQYVDHFRLAIWSLFNIAVPDEFLAESAAPMVSTLSALRIYHNAIDYRMLGRWLNDRGVPSISQFTATLMADYAEYLRTERRVARGTAVNHLTAITRLWVIGLQLPTLSLPDVPPWVGGRLSDYLPPRVGNSGENDTEPIATSTMSPLLTAALRFIDVGTEPILAAATLNQDIYNHSRAKSLSRNREGAGKLRDYLNDLSNASARFPTKLHNGKVALDCAYIAHTVGVSVSVVYNWSKGTAVRAYAAAHGAPITVPLASSELMPERIARTEIDTYVNYLRAACFIIIAYLTGMRPGKPSRSKQDRSAPPQPAGVDANQFPNLQDSARRGRQPRLERTHPRCPLGRSHSRSEGHPGVGAPSTSGSPVPIRAARQEQRPLSWYHHHRRRRQPLY